MNLWARPQGVKFMRLRDTSTDYGWISIVQHWLSAVLVLVVWFLGNSTQASQSENAPAVAMHTSFAVLAYVALIGRIVWRIVEHHPGPQPKQRGWSFTLAKFLHTALLLAISIMLVSGPLMAWSTGDAIQVFEFTLPSPIGTHPDLWSFMHAVHESCALFIAYGVLLHVAGVLKHIIFNRDGTFDKMMVPANRPDPASHEPRP